MMLLNGSLLPHKLVLYFLLMNYQLPTNAAPAPQNQEAVDNLFHPQDSNNSSSVHNVIPVAPTPDQPQDHLLARAVSTGHGKWNASMREFPFVAHSKLIDMIKEGQPKSAPAPAFPANSSVFVRTLCDVEQKATVTFEQARDSIVEAWHFCRGNPQCQLMQILGEIDNTLELQHKLIEQISFLNKLFIIQRKLITDVFNEGQVNSTVQQIGIKKRFSKKINKMKTKT